MKPDIYTKVVLTVMAIMLAVIACNQYVHPTTIVQAQGPFAGVQVSAGSSPSVFDPRTGEVAPFTTTYGGTADDPAHTGEVWERLKLTKVGSPLTVICGGLSECKSK